jgi:hypothetical protein
MNTVVLNYAYASSIVGDIYQTAGKHIAEGMPEECVLEEIIGNFLKIDDGMRLDPTLTREVYEVATILSKIDKKSGPDVLAILEGNQFYRFVVTRFMQNPQLSDEAKYFMKEFLNCKSHR